MCDSRWGDNVSRGHKAIPSILPPFSYVGITDRRHDEPAVSQRGRQYDSAILLWAHHPSLKRSSYCSTEGPKGGRNGIQIPEPRKSSIGTVSSNESLSNTAHRAPKLGELGQLILNLVNVIPAGVVVFFPSYNILDTVRRLWSADRTVEKIGSRKKVSAPSWGGFCV